MRPLLALLGVSAMIGLAAPAHGDPDGSSDDTGFLATVRGAGITYTDPAQAVAFGKAVCGLIGAGKSGSELVHDLQRNNPGMTTDHATLFVGISAKYYCPQQLAGKPASAR
ncbi:DUF732 domain-containing protein [Mycobacterium sp. Aquia_216]|uniref:DUF732 domain-containing protein n=1 Tax=Mycobacterium sp. Aquia_216 TaxID=2991729 RepID=UPI00227BC211|nr:DUF732 domain-containing protein [Mycobacterium sp. Aquia_216]WAJ42632.1 DUF732 domain-containing protein [Mycobacterium sp. Aquia_216]